MSLKQRIVSAVGWSVGIKLVIQIVTWAMTLIVIRLLTPDDYGLAAVSQIFANVMMGFAALGLGDALIQKEETPKIIVARVFGMLLFSSATLTIGLALAAYPIANWYNDQRLVALIQVSSLGFMFNGLSSLPRAYLTKALHIRPMFIMELSSGLVGAASVITLAHLGYGVWALMLGWLATNVVKLVGYVVLGARYYVWPRFGFQGIGGLFSFGIYRTLEYTVWMAYTSIDLLVISRWLGPSAVGIYAVALNFATMPLIKIAPILNSTAFPAFALVQGRPAEARFYALKALRLMAVIAVPIFFGLSATAPEIVDLVFGPRWADAKMVLTVLAPAVTFRAILIVIPNYLQGIGDSRAGFWCTMASAAVFVPAFVIGCYWGTVGVAAAWLIAYPVVYVLNAAIAAKRGGLDFWAIMAVPLRPIALGIIMFMAVAVVRNMLPPSMPVISVLAILVCTGAVTYCAGVMLLARDIAQEMRQLLLREPSPAG